MMDRSGCFPGLSIVHLVYVAANLDLVYGIRTPTVWLFNFWGSGKSDGVFTN